MNSYLIIAGIMSFSLPDGWKASVDVVGILIAEPSCVKICNKYHIRYV